MIMKNQWMVAMTAVALWGAGPLLAADQDGSKGKDQNAAQNSKETAHSAAKNSQDRQGDDDADHDDNDEQGPKMSYLGVVVEPLHPAFGTHLQHDEHMKNGQGVMVAHVTKGSPADQAGLKPHDIIVLMDDQKIFVPEQVLRLVQSQKPGQQVKLKVMRNGQAKDLTATLKEEPDDVAEQRRAANEIWEWDFSENPAMGAHGAHQQAGHGQPGNGQAKGEMDHTFDSLSLKRVEGKKNQFKAEIVYLDKDGKRQHHEFTGTRKDIAEQIRNEKDLPDAERRQLLNGVQLRPQMLEPEVWFVLPDDGGF